MTRLQQILVWALAVLVLARAADAVFVGGPPTVPFLDVLIFIVAAACLGALLAAFATDRPKDWRDGVDRVLSIGAVIFIAGLSYLEFTEQRVGPRSPVGAQVRR
jgi:peptidoglycan/LPS O-acetylase OafA/YrhL